MSTKLEKRRSLMSNAGLFFLAGLIPKVISFFMVPLYTNCLTTGEYGTIDLITTTVQLLLPVLTLQVQDAVLRFSMEKDQEPARVFTTGLRIALGGCGILLLGTGAVYATGLVRLEWPYMVFFLANFLTGALHHIVSYFLRAVNKVKLITIGTVINSVVTVGCNLLFLLAFRWGVNGYLLANILGYVLSILFLVLSGRLHRYVDFRKPDKDLTNRIIRFSIPMVVSALSWWVNNSLDKYILTLFCGVSASGLLAVAYKIPTILSLVGATVSKAFSISVLQNFDPDDKDGFLGQSYAAISFLSILCASGLMLLNVPLSRLLFSKEFFAAWKLVPPLLIAAAMNHLLASCEHLFVALKKTHIISVTALLGAGINIVLNVCLIPILEAYGAALATAAGFFVVWLVRYVWVRRYVNLKNCRVKEPVSYGLILCQMGLAYWGNRLVLAQAAIAAVLVLLYRKEIAGVLKRSAPLRE